MTTAPQTHAQRMPRQPKSRTLFAERLLNLRKARGMTQIALAEAIGTTQRVVSYYETEADNPSADVLVSLGKALRVSTDELLGVKPIRSIDEAPSLDPALRRYWRRFLQLKELPEKDQRAVFRMLDTMAKANTEVIE